MNRRVEITLACGQFAPRFGEIGFNLEQIRRMVEATDADLFIFPELCTSGYEFQDRKEAFDLALDLDRGKELSWLSGLAGDTGTHLVLGFPERAGDKVFNAALLVEPSGKAHFYRKIHLFDREKELFDTGDMPFAVIDTAGGRIGVMICFDWIFPEAARTLALGGAQVIAHPSNLVLQYCQKAMFARSVENGVFTATCNRVGAESRAGRTLTFTGASQILSNRGATLAQASSDGEEVIHALITPSDADNKMITGRNHLVEDRREEWYA
ncbi:MAG: hypothetical protein FJY67_04610 [Calditrichaeota bacterium]|nr:hypothetical protein [Calditrichota bacterium]